MRMADIKKATAAFYRVRVSDLDGRDRPAQVAHARQVAMFLSWVATARSYSDVGRVFGRNPSTVRFAVKTVTKKMFEGPYVAAEVTAILRALKGPAPAPAAVPLSAPGLRAPQTR